jgi:HK97 family phage major capsid protein
MEPELKAAIEKVQGELAGFIAKFNEEKKTLGAGQQETADAIRLLTKRQDEFEVRAVRPAPGSSNHSGFEGFLETMKASDEVQRLLSLAKGHARVQFKDAYSRGLLETKTITESGVGFATAGVLPQEREPGIVWAARPTLVMRDVLALRPTAAAQIMWVRESVRPTKGSPVAEASSKPLSDMTFTTEYEPVKTIALCVRTSKQILDDWTELEAFLRGEFRSRVLEEEDRQILYGDGTGQNLHGLIHQGTAWDLTLLDAGAGYEYLDVLNGAQQQVAEANEFQGRQFFVLHPGDWRYIRRTKDSTGRYILGDPQTIVMPNIWGAPVVETTQITKGTFLLGSGDEQCAIIRERQGVTVDLSTEDADNFTQNLVTVRVELRLALIVKRPAALIQGSFTQSPA